MSLPEDVRAAARKAASPLRIAGGDAKWAAVEHMHLTLAFLGEVSAEQAELAKAALQATASGRPAFEAALGRLGAFPDLDHPKVIWAGLSRGEAEMSALAEALRARLKAGALPFDEKPFVAHLTLARVKRPGELKALRAKIEGSPSLSGSFRVAEVCLLESRLTPAGPRYSVIAAAKLG